MNKNKITETIELERQGNGVITEMEKQLGQAILNRNFDEYYKWIKIVLYKKTSKEICQDQFEIFQKAFRPYRIFIDPELKKIKENLLGFFQEEFTDNDPIIQCKIFEGILEGIFLEKQIEGLKNKLASFELNQIDNLYFQQQNTKNENYNCSICYSSFLMLIAEISREHDQSVSDFLTNFDPLQPLKIIDENLMKILQLHGDADTKKKPKLLIGLFIKTIWNMVEKIDKRFISMYRNAQLPFERYPKVTNSKDIIEKIKNVKKYNNEVESGYFERWLNYLRGKQEVESAKLKTWNTPLIKVLEDLENRAVKNENEKVV